MTKMIRAQLLLGLTTLLLVAGTQSAYAAGVVNLPCTQTELHAALSGGGLVTFNCGAAPVTITLTSTEGISTNNTIDGGGLVTISGGNTVGVFVVSSGVTFTVQNLTIANGNSVGHGGGIYNAGTLTVTNSSFSGNNAFLGNGGGIFNAGTLTVSNSTFSSNSAFNLGGGIYNAGTLTVTNSTFSGNFARLGGGGIINVAGTLTVTNSTVSGNSALLGGGIANFGTLTVTNSIVTNSTSGGNCSGGGTITDGGHNLDDGTTCGFSTANGSLSNTNPLLDPAGLQNNGGPTQTIALCTRPGTPASCTEASPAIDAGNQAVCAAAPVNDVDQRGFPRSFLSDPVCDIGAFEVQHPNPVPAASTGGLLGLVMLLSALAWLRLHPTARTIAGREEHAFVGRLSANVPSCSSR